MILTCPNCNSQFRVDPAQIPPEGRMVRCASCKHQWHTAAQSNQAAELAYEMPAEDEHQTAAEEVEKLIAYPDPPAQEEALAQEEAQQTPIAAALPEDAFEGDADVMQDPPEPEPEPEDEAGDAQEEPRGEPELISSIEPSNSFFDEDEAPEDEGGVSEKTKASLKPLLALAAGLLIVVFVTSLFALRPALQSQLGFVYSLFGAQPSDGLALAQLSLRERPSRSKARFVIEGQVINSASQPRYVPMIRIAAIGHDGQVLQVREYEDGENPLLDTGESYSFKATNLELESKAQLAWFVVDIGTGGELMLRPANDDMPQKAQAGGGDVNG